jgi:hypothetical protein
MRPVDERVVNPDMGEGSSAAGSEANSVAQSFLGDGADAAFEGFCDGGGRLLRLGAGPELFYFLDRPPLQLEFLFHMSNVSYR